MYQGSRTRIFSAFIMGPHRGTAPLDTATVRNTIPCFDHNASAPGNSLRPGSGAPLQTEGPPFD